VVAIVEDVEREVREDRGRALGHPAVVVGVAQTSEREVHGPVERPQAVEIER
jgi:hypothetical protein